MSNNYLIIGDDEHIKQTEANRIKEKFLSSGQISLNYSAYNPDNVNVSDIMNSLETMPFLAEKRVVLVSQAHDLSGDAQTAILSYLESPSKTSVLVLSSNGSFKKTKHYNKLSSLVEIVKADVPNLSTIKDWIRAFFKKNKIEISHEAVELIVELKGTDTSGVKRELEKLISFSGGEKIELWHVEDLVGRSVTETIFKLVDAINARDGKWAFRILGDLYEQKKQPQEIVGYLTWYIKVIRKIASLTAGGMGLDKQASQLGYSPGYVRRLMNQSKKYPAGKIKRWIDLLLAADRDIKTGGKKPRLAVEILLSSLLYL